MRFPSLTTILPSTPKFDSALPDLLVIKIRMSPKEAMLLITP